MAQYGGLAAMDVDTADHVAAYRHKRDLIYSRLSEKFEIQKPGGGFYIFPKAPQS